MWPGGPRVDDVGMTNTPNQTATPPTAAEGQAYLQRWADMDVVGVRENEDGSVSLDLVSLLGNMFHITITGTREA